MLNNSSQYIRLTGDNLTILYEEDYNFEIGKAIRLKKGKELAILHQEQEFMMRY